MQLNKLLIKQTKPLLLPLFSLSEQQNNMTPCPDSAVAVGQISAMQTPTTTTTTTTTTFRLLSTATFIRLRTVHKKQTGPESVIIHQPSHSPVSPVSSLFYSTAVWRWEVIQGYQQYLVHTEILSTFHTRVEYISQWTICHSEHSNKWWCKCRKIHSPFPWGTWTPSNTSMPGPTPLTTPNSSIAVHTSTQLHNKGSNGYNGTPKIHPQNRPFPFDDHHQNLMHPFLDRPHSPQMASGSNQPFWGVTKYCSGCSGRRRSAAEDPKQHPALLRRTKLPLVIDSDWRGIWVKTQSV